VNNEENFNDKSLYRD